MDGWNPVRDWEDELLREVVELTDSQKDNRTRFVAGTEWAIFSVS